MLMKIKKYNCYSSELTRLLNFQSATRFGPIFVCSSCDQKMFENGVHKLSDDLKERIKAINEDIFENVLSNNIQEIDIKVNGVSNKSAYLCVTCKTRLL